MRRTAPRLTLLLMIVQAACDRVMHVVDLRHKIRDGQLQLMRPQPAGLGLRNQTQPRTQVQQDVGGLGDHQEPQL